MEPIEILKVELKKRNVSWTDLAKLSGLPRYTINNILMGTSRRYDHLFRLFEALQIPIYINRDYKKSIPIKIEDPDCYFKAHKIVNSLINKKNMPFITKPFLEEIIYTLYTYMLENKADENVYRGYAEGFITKEVSNKIK